MKPGGMSDLTIPDEHDYVEWRGRQVCQECGEERPIPDKE